MVVQFRKWLKTSVWSLESWWELWVWPVDVGPGYNLGYHHGWSVDHHVFSCFPIVSWPFWGINPVASDRLEEHVKPALLLDPTRLVISCPSISLLVARWRQDIRQVTCAEWVFHHAMDETLWVIPDIPHISPYNASRWASTTDKKIPFKQNSIKKHTFVGSRVSTSLKMYMYGLMWFKCDFWFEPRKADPLKSHPAARFDAKRSRWIVRIHK